MATGGFERARSSGRGTCNGEGRRGIGCVEENNRGCRGTIAHCSDVAVKTDERGARHSVVENLAAGITDTEAAGRYRERCAPGRGRR